MEPLNVVLLQGNSGISQTLIDSLSGQTGELYLAQSQSELRSSIIQHQAQAVILDLELSSLSEVRQLSQEFPGVSIVCHHRIADEKMWTASLSAGAADCCPSSDTKGIARAVAKTSDKVA